MATAVKYYFGTEAQILALTSNDANWTEMAFYYPTDKTYFYQIIDGVMKQYGIGSSTSTGIGVSLNDKTLGGVKVFIEENDILEIPENYDYNTFTMKVEGLINNAGQINIL